MQEISEYNGCGIDNYSCCFIITQKYSRNYKSYIKSYVDNIKRFYSNHFIIIVDNNSNNLEDVQSLFVDYTNMVILVNDSPSKFELGGFIYGLKWLIQHDKINSYDYYVFSQDTLVMINKYDLNILKSNNITACVMVEFDQNTSGLRGYLDEEKKQVLDTIGLYGHNDKIT